MSNGNATPNLEKGGFSYDIEGTHWVFKSTIYDMSSTKRKSYTFSNEYIELFEYDNQINNFLLTGQLIYRDHNGRLGQFFRLQHLFVNVWWSEQPYTVPKNPDRAPHVEDGDGEPIYTPTAPEDQFYHLFLVNKIEIIRHDMPEDVLVYKLELISAYWYQFAATCRWSNYADKTPWLITEIICDILVKTVGEEMVDTESFKSDDNRTELRIFYTSTEQDNAITAINYLLNRMYMEPASFDVDNHPRVIVFDEWTNMWRMANLNKDSTFMPVKDSRIQLARWWDVSEKEIDVISHRRARGEKEEVTSVSKIGYTKSVEEFFARSYWDINIVKDKFVRKFVESDKIVNLFLATIQDPNYEFRPATYNIEHESNEGMLPSITPNGYIINESAWNNKRHIYSDQLYRILYRDTFEIRKNNRVNHQPCQIFVIPEHKDQKKKDETVDASKIDPNDSTSPIKHDLQADRQLFGYWLTTKTRHMAMFYNTGDEQSPEAPRFFELLSMTKYNTINP